MLQSDQGYGGLHTSPHPEYVRVAQPLPDIIWFRFQHFRHPNAYLA